MAESLDFEQLFEETQDMIYSLGLRLFRSNADEALDFAQDVYVQAYRKKHQFQGRSKPSTWLYSLALNLGLNRIKKEKRVRMVSTDADDAPELSARYEDIPDHAVTEMLERKDLEIKIRTEVEALPEVYRLPLVLFYFEKLSYKEIAEKLGLPAGTLKSYLHRARELLRASLKDLEGQV